MFVKMVMIYVRGAKERRYLRDLLGPLVRQVLEDDFLDLESDPLMVTTLFFYILLHCTVHSIFRSFPFIPYSKTQILFPVLHIQRSTKPASTTRS
jgi:hypothetical protein